EADQGWNDDGRRAELTYADLAEPIPLGEIPVEWRIAEGGPFTRDGAVKQGYLFQLSDDFVAKLVNRFPQLVADGPIKDPPLREPYDEPAFDVIAEGVAEAGMTLSKELLRRYHVSLKTRGFVVLSGVSGTGKTWLAEAYADAVKANAIVVPVAPNWTTNEDLLG